MKEILQKLVDTGVNVSLFWNHFGDKVGFDLLITHGMSLHEQFKSLEEIEEYLSNNIDDFIKQIEENNK